MTSPDAITATLTADNHYGLYFGSADGSSLTFVGRNEVGAAGNPGTYNWSEPETVQFEPGVGNYIYVVVWDDGSEQMFAGQFDLPGDLRLVSDTTHWQYTVGGTNPGASGAVPTLSELESVIGTATWAIPAASASQGTAPWGAIPGLSEDVQFVWPDTLGVNSASDGHYVIFRTVAPVSPTNHPPSAIVDFASTDENVPLTITTGDLLANDTDMDGDLIQVVSVTGTSDNGGAVSLNDNGTPADPSDDFLSYAPALNFSGIDSFEYTIRDSFGWTDTATVYVLVNSTEVTATLTADNHYGLYFGTADGSNLSFVGRNEVGVNGDPGTSNWSLPETFTFQPGTDDYIYVAVWDDGGPQMWSGQFDLPNGVTLVSETTHWQYTVASGANPGANGDVPPLVDLQSTIAGATWATPESSAPNGTAPWGSIPGLDDDVQFVWHDTLDYNSSSDGHYVIFRTMVPVRPFNKPPDAQDDALSANMNVPAVIHASALLGNDSDADGDPFQIVGVTASSANGGSVVLSDNGTPADPSDDFLTYAPPADFVGDDAFQYTVRDSFGWSSVATVTVTVGTPGADDDFAFTHKNLATTISTLDLLSNDFDPAGQSLRIVSVTATSVNGGTVSVDNNGTPADFSDDFIVYAPPTDFVGDDSFEYTVSDTSGLTVTATVSVAVSIPDVQDDFAFTNENSTVNIGTVDLLANDVDPGGGALAVTAIASTSAHGGTVALSDNGTPATTSDDFVVYTPAHDFTGIDTFQYTVTDSLGVTAIATVTVNVRGPAISNAAPVLAATDAQTIPAGYAVAFTATAIDADLPFDKLTYSLDPGSPVGASIDPLTGDFAWTPTSAQTGRVTINVRVTDSGSPTASDVQAVTIVVTPNSLPVANGNIYGTRANGPGFEVTATFGVLSDDSDPNQGTLTAVLDAAPAHGTLILHADGGFTYTPAPNFLGEDSFVYHAEAQDGRKSAQATVQLEVQAIFQGGATTGPEAVPGNSVYHYVTAFDPIAANKVPANGTSGVTNSDEAGAVRRFRYWVGQDLVFAIGVDFAFKNDRPAAVDISIKYTRDDMLFISAPKRVNLVQVVIKTPQDAFTIGTPREKVGLSEGQQKIDSKTFEEYADNKIVASGPAQAPGGITWKATVTLTGPGKNGSLGVSQINVGFIQHVVPASYSVYFPTINKTIVSNLVGNTYLDQDRNIEQHFFKWYTPSNKAVLYGAKTASDTITAGDTPGAVFPVVWPFQKGIVASKVSYHADFVLDIAAMSEAEESLDSYFIQSTASWSSDLSGTVASGAGKITWNPIAGITGNTKPAGGWQPVNTVSKAKVDQTVAGAAAMDQEWRS
ncbi:MAG: tandem-95 repeat protein [Gemmataceae bacterium]|nr:tandem-95 repeat protein [Gemmataceae bacterium]